MMKLLTLVALAVLSTACGDVDGFEVEGFDSPEDWAALESAGSEWCLATGHCATWTGGASRISQRATLAIANTNGHWHGDGASEIEVLDSLEPDTLRYTILHELGHHFGCQNHLTDQDTVMFWSADSTARHLTQADLECVD